MRLAYLSTDQGVPYGGAKGACVHITEMVRALAREGARVLVLVREADPDAEAPPEGVTVEVLPGPGPEASASQRIGWQGAMQDEITGRLRRFGAEALFERLTLYSAVGTRAAGRLGVPHLVELNAPVLEEAARYRSLHHPDVADALEAETLRGADLVFAVSPPLVAHARERGARRVEVLQNAVDIDRFSVQRRSNGHDPVAVFVGSGRPWHGLESIVEAWRLLGAQAPRLLVVGERGVAAEPLADAGARLVGTVPPSKVPELLAEADIGLAPYQAGAPRYFSPIKLFEYLGAGLATIVADLPAVVEVVDPFSALIVPAGDAEAVADGVARLVRDAPLRRSLGERGRALVAARHTWRHRARRVLEAIAELEGQGAARA